MLLRAKRLTYWAKPLTFKGERNRGWWEIGAKRPRGEWEKAKRSDIEQYGGAHKLSCLSRKDDNSTKT